MAADPDDIDGTITLFFIGRMISIYRIPGDAYRLKAD